MDKKEKYLKVREAQVNRLEPQLDKLKFILNGNSGADDGEASKVIEDLENQVYTVKEKLDELKKSQDDRASDVMNAAEEAWQNVKSGLSEASKRMS